MSDTPPTIALYSMTIAVTEQPTDYEAMRYQASTTLEEVGTFTATGPTSLSARAAALRLAADKCDALADALARYASGP